MHSSDTWLAVGVDSIRSCGCGFNTGVIAQKFVQLALVRTVGEHDWEGGVHVPHQDRRPQARATGYFH